jgi:L-asparaginase/beta-aspartyl-peptidase (threonine type)
MISFGVIVHGGVGSPGEVSDGCSAACETAFRMIEAGQSALDAVTEATRLMEDDGRFNAGRGSALRLDGKTVEMDAAVMDSMGNIGSVINVRNVRNPVLVARAVVDTPHVALAGRGAEEFALRLGFQPFFEISERSRKKYEKNRKLMDEGKIGQVNPLWKGIDASFLKKFSSDTVGSAALDRNGIFAVAASTGGASPMMVGRVGDTPMPGCGFYAGPAGAVAATGVGEEIIKQMLAKNVYDLMGREMALQETAEKCVRLFPAEIKVGIISITRKGYGISANDSMAHYAMVRED